MSLYSRVLVAVDLTEECKLVADRANDIAKVSSADLHLIHVIEPIALSYGGDIPMDVSSVQESITDQTESYIATFSQGYNIPSDHQHLVYGRPEREIHRFAQENEVDCIVVGSHGRHGLALLFGSTANGVLHGAPCDIIAVRVGVQKILKEAV
ncbi:MAG: universal stress protein [Gammaproteobacteria bacterium]|nr:universal stress protein [Gammaproteobacteria bacterium]